MNLIFFVLSVICYGVSQLVQHGQFRWMTNDDGFWGHDSYIRKYKLVKGARLSPGVGWYYKFFKIKYKERFPLSATFLVLATDGYHLCQSLFFFFLSLGIYLTGINIFDYWLWDFLTVWFGVLFVHWLTRQILSK
jgi:hypothetical protein